MNPLRLSLKNFLCYRGHVGPISFASLHLACLCGDNGAGKSALLDAITWALWGKARGRGDDDLVHTGEREMEVEFDFDLHGQSYRVIRQHLKNLPHHPGRSVLELQLISGQDSRSLSRPTLRETQRYLEEELLHMDYDTFINSAFLLQGRADEFTTKTPGKRKEVLTQVLGLIFYDELEAKAKALKEERRTDRLTLSRSMEQLQAELSRRPEYERGKHEAEAKFSQIDQELSVLEASQSNLRQRLERLRLSQEQMAKIEKEMAPLADNIASWGRAVVELEQQVEELEHVKGQRQDIEAGYSRYLKARQMEAEWSNKALKLRALEGRRVELERAIREGQGKLEQERAVLSHRLADLCHSQESLSLREGEMAEVQAEIARLDEAAKKLQLDREQAQDLSGRLHRLQASREQVEGQRRELSQKRELMIQGGAHCPLCGAELGPDKHHDLEAEYASQENELAQALASLSQEIEQNQRQHQGLQRLIHDGEVGLNQQLPLALDRRGSLQAQIDQARQAASKVSQVKERLTGVEGQLAGYDWAPEQRAELSRVEEAIKALGYDPEQHQAARQQMDKGQIYQTKQARLEEADRHLASIRMNLERARHTLQEQLNQMEQKQQEKVARSQELSLLPPLEKECQQSENRLRSLRDDKEQVQHALGAIEENLRRCAKWEQEGRELRAKQELMAEEESIYEELTEAFGKGGVQALLIEQALPQLAQEADNLLKRLTANRMGLDFQTQRLTRKGAAVETLDIIISDELGTRSYEMFSGGEAFRIDFALRVALARLVARRAGAPLSLLVIDEGFGTQDAEGRERLVEAINTVAQDFDKVLVVTHMEELKERFASRIEVTKTEDGSRVEVLA